VTPGGAETLPSVLGELASALAVPLVVVVVVWVMAERLAGLFARLAMLATGRRDPVVSSVRTGREGMVGEIGVARTALAPHGKVFVHGELWNAVADAPVAARQEVEVTAVDGLTLRVAPRAAVDSRQEAC
jgi:membrane-bound ClpP family serine protease